MNYKFITVKDYILKSHLSCLDKTIINYNRKLSKKQLSRTRVRERFNKLDKYRNGSGDDIDLEELESIWSWEYQDNDLCFKCDKKYLRPECFDNKENNYNSDLISTWRASICHACGYLACRCYYNWDDYDDPMWEVHEYW